MRIGEVFSTGALLRVRDGDSFAAGVVIVRQCDPGCEIIFADEFGSFVATASADGVASIEVPVREGRIRGQVKSGGERIDLDVPVEMRILDTVHMVPHFHYDPVWWNTQAAFVSDWSNLPDAAAGAEFPGQHDALHLVELHLDAAESNAAYKFALSEIDYLHPIWISRPDLARRIRRAINSNQLELVGAQYNQPASTLMGLELASRGIELGSEFHRRFGRSSKTAWLLDVFGHDASQPALLSAYGLENVAFGRGPYHDWGLIVRRGGHPEMSYPADIEFGSEFRWASPGGGSILASYLPATYTAGWWSHYAVNAEDASEELVELVGRLAGASNSPELIVPVGMDHTEPHRWLHDQVDRWNRRHKAPRMQISLPSEYFASLRSSSEQLAQVQTRDLNTVFDGTLVSYIDTKQTHAALQLKLTQSEALATVVMQLNPTALDPREKLAEAWRQLVFASHHDAVTGTEGDQVFVDLLAGWRRVWDIIESVNRAAAAALEPSGRAARTFFSMNRRSSPSIVSLQVPGPSVARVGDVDLRSVFEPINDSGGLLHFAMETPSSILSAITVEVVSDQSADEWREIDGFQIENARFRVTLDPERGGGIVSLVDKRYRRELIPTGAIANEVTFQDEYQDDPVNHETGPWMILPKGSVRARTSDHPADVVIQMSSLGQRALITSELDGVRVLQVLTLWRDAEILECRTDLSAFRGADELVRVRWAVDAPAAVPVADTATYPIGKSFGAPERDAAELPWTFTAGSHTWLGLSAPALIAIRGPHSGYTRAIGVAEIVISEEFTRDAASSLALALANWGVTTTITRADGPAYGDANRDSNIPDTRIVVVSDSKVLCPEWSENEHVLLVPLSSIDSVLVQLLDGRIEAWSDQDESATSFTHSVALLHRGLPGGSVEADAIWLSLLRSNTGWPSGVWVSAQPQQLPDGSGFGQQHWPHTFEYAFAAGDGDWRQAELAASAREYLEQPLDLPGIVPWSAVCGELDFIEPGISLTSLRYVTTVEGSGRLVARLITNAFQHAISHEQAREVSLDGQVLVGAAGEPVQIGPYLPSAIVLGGDVRPKWSHLSDPPSFSRYWMTNRGAAPAAVWNSGVVLPSKLTPEGPFLRGELVIAGSSSPRLSDFELDAPSGSELHEAQDGIDLRVLAPKAMTDFAARVEWKSSTGRVFDERIYDASGEALSTVELNSAVSSTWQSQEVELVAGSSEDIGLTVRLDLKGDIRVHADVEFLTPWGTWSWLVASVAGPIRSGTATPFSTRVVVPLDAVAGEYWVIARVAFAGTVHYSSILRMAIRSRQHGHEGEGFPITTSR